MAEGEEEKIVAGAGGADEEKAIVLAGAGDEEETAIVLAGAGDDEEKAVVLAGAGDDEKQEGGAWFRPPPGFRFTPGEDELVIYYLLPKLQGREHVPNHSIIEANVYESHPDVLTATHKKRGGESWYFLSPRARKYRNGRRPSRSTEDKLGRWKASTSSKEGNVKLAGDGKTKYSWCTLNYYEGKIKGETKSKWIMREITIPEYENQKGGVGDGDKDVLDQYVMCRIYLTTRPKGRQCKVVEEEEAGPSGTQPEPEPAEESGQAGATANLSEKQAGKRPAEDQTLGNAATCTAPKRARHPNPDRLHLGPPAPLHAGNGMQGPFMAPMGNYGGGPGHPMGYHARAPVPRPPPMVYNNGQAPVAYNRQVHVPRQQMGYNGQSVPLPRQQVACNGQGPQPRQQAGFCGQSQQQAAYNCQAMRALSPPYWPGDSYGQIQNQAMAMRPPCPPAGQAVNPPSSVVPRPAQTQKQSETEAMRFHRVIQQNLREFHRISQGAMPPSPGAAFAAHRQRSTTQQQQPPTAFPQQQQQRQIMQQQKPTASTQEQQQPMASTQQQRQLMQQQPPPAFTQEQHLRMMQFMQQQHWRMMQPQQQPYNFGANGNYHRHAGAMAPQFSLDNFNASQAAQHYHNQRSRVLPPAMRSSAGVSGVVSGAGGEVTGANRDCNNGGNMELVGSTTVGESPSAAADGT